MFVVDIFNIVSLIISIYYTVCFIKEYSVKDVACITIVVNIFLFIFMRQIWTSTLLLVACIIVVNDKLTTNDKPKTVDDLDDGLNVTFTGIENGLDE